MNFKTVILMFACLLTGILNGCGSSGEEDKTSEEKPVITNYFSPIMLEGEIVTPETVIPDGWVVISNGVIESVSEQKPNVSNATEIQTHGIIYPGLIDLHNHVVWNIFPCWQPDEKFDDRYIWQKDPEYENLYGTPEQNLTWNHQNKPDYTCDMNAYGEIRALIGGTTSILSTSTRNECISGLVRNLDYASGLHGPGEPDSDYIVNKIFLNPDQYTEIQNHFSSPKFRAFVIHLAEGTDELSHHEFDSLDGLGLLTSKTVIVHGIELGEAEFQKMQDSSASLVWSPYCDELLYGKTINIPLALSHNIPIALSPDWSISGSGNLLAELKYADKWCSAHMNKPLSDTTLVEMATSIPAVMAGIDTLVGSIKNGMRADLMVISGNTKKPYRSLIDAKESDVELVLINGVPLYGDPAIMSQYWKDASLSNVQVGGKNKLLKMENGTFNQLADRLQNALNAYDITLAPLDGNCSGFLLPSIDWPKLENTINLPETRIKFNIPSDDNLKMSNVKLVIYNSRGQEVATLINERLSAGSHAASWNTSNFAGGIYYYVLTVGDYTESKKLMLMK